MKKLLAIFLSLIIIFSMAACGTSVSDTDDTTNTASDTNDAANNESGDSTAQGNSEPVPADTGNFDPEYDYSVNPRYKFAYVSNATSALVETFSDSLQEWANQMNLEYLGLVEFGGDNDAMISMLPTLAKDNDGLILDPDPMIFPRVAEIMDECGCPWISGQAQARNYESADLVMLHPYVGFNDYMVGSIAPAQLLAMKDELWPDVPLSEFGFITVDFSIAPTFYQREAGCRDSLAQLAPELMDRYFVADTSIKIFDVDTSAEVVSAILSKNPEIKYWLVYGELDDMAQGAATAIDTMGLTDTSCVASFGGPGLINQWDAGVHSAWRTSCYLPTSMYTEPIICGLYAMMQGTATPDTLWPEWVNINDCGGEGHTYASRLIPYYWITEENYKEICKWGDIYAGTNYYPDYPADGLTRDTYSAEAEIPAYYKG